MLSLSLIRYITLDHVEKDACPSNPCPGPSFFRIKHFLANYFQSPDAHDNVLMCGKINL